MYEILDDKYNNNKRKLRKITCDWDEKNTKKLIKYVKSHRVLWDPLHHDYKNREIRELEWKLIGTEIFSNNTSDGEVCTKWQNLRSQYHNYNKKYKRGSNNNKNVKWKYFNMLQFLPVPTYKISDMNSKKTDMKLEIPDIEEKNNIDYKKGDYNIEVIMLPKPLNDKTIMTNTENGTISNNNNNTNNSEEFLDTITDNILNTSFNSVSDEYSDFGRFVANELRNLKYASDLQSKLKRQIQRYIVDIADEYALRINLSENIKYKKYNSTSSSATSLLATTISSSSTSDCYTECKLEVEDN